MTATWLHQTPSFLVPYNLFSFLMACHQARKELIFRLFHLWDGDGVTELQRKKYDRIIGLFFDQVSLLRYNIYF